MFSKEPVPIESRHITENLHLVKAKAVAQQLARVDFVLDDAIYCTASEIISNPVNSSLKNTIHFHLGGFHAECISLSMI